MSYGNSYAEYVRNIYKGRPRRKVSNATLLAKVDSLVARSQKRTGSPPPAAPYGHAWEYRNGRYILIRSRSNSGSSSRSSKPKKRKAVSQAALLRKVDDILFRKTDRSKLRYGSSKRKIDSHTPFANGGSKKPSKVIYYY